MKKSGHSQAAASIPQGQKKLQKLEGYLDEKVDDPDFNVLINGLLRLNREKCCLRTVFSCEVIY